MTQPLNKHMVQQGRGCSKQCLTFSRFQPSAEFRWMTINRKPTEEASSSLWAPAKCCFINFSKPAWLVQNANSTSSSRLFWPCATICINNLIQESKSHCSKLWHIIWQSISLYITDSSFHLLKSIVTCLVCVFPEDVVLTKVFRAEILVSLRQSELVCSWRRGGPCLM